VLWLVHQAAPKRPVVIYAVLGTAMIFGRPLCSSSTQLHKAASLVHAMASGTAIARGLAPRTEKLTRVFTWVVPCLLVLLPALGGLALRTASPQGTPLRSRTAIPPRAGAPNVLLLVLRHGSKLELSVFLGY
jgi:hypothetical protein